MMKWTLLLLCLLALASQAYAQRRRHGGNSNSRDRDDDDDDDHDKTLFWASVGGIVLIVVLSIVGAAAFSFCAWIVCTCHEKCRKDRVKHTPGCQKLSGRHSSVAPDWTSRLIVRSEFLNKGFSEMSDGFYSLNISHLVRQRPGVAVTDGARWAVPMTSGKHLFEIIWPWGCRGKHATVGVGTANAPLKGKGGVNLVGGNSNSWGLDIVRRRVMHNNKQMGACPSNGAYVPDRFLMYIDLDEGKLGFGCDVTFWGFVITNLPTGGRKPVYVMVGADKWQAQVQVYYRGSAGSGDDSEAFAPRQGFILPPLTGLTVPQPLMPPDYNDVFDQPGKNNDKTVTPANKSQIYFVDEWKPEPPPSPTAPADGEDYEPPPPYASPLPEY